jgi:LmbE family N-acetylglucosaminyl deacetylase
MEPTGPKVVLTLMAHPDDAEILCGGTLLRLLDRGWLVHLATATPGDCGSASLPPEEIAAIRRKEGRTAAGLLRGEFHCLEARDLLVFYGEPLVRRATALLRRVRPHLVITHSPQDYMPDHEQISLVARAACFNAPIPNAPVADLPGDTGRGGRGAPAADPPAPSIPHLYYADPIEGKDPLGRAVDPAICVDVSDCLERKVELLAAHASQREWLRHHHGMDEYIESMRRWGAERGKLIGTPCAEGFRQHLGHAFPQDDLLRAALGPPVRALPRRPT